MKAYTPDWLLNHRAERHPAQTHFSRAEHPSDAAPPPLLLSDEGFNSHKLNDGTHVSPYDNATIQVGLDGLEVRLLQGVDQQSFANVLHRATRATTGLPVPQPGDAEDADWEEMMRGGLQSALETQTIVFEVWGASRALSHQLVRSRRAGFHQQSQRATWYGDSPEVRMPESVWRADQSVRLAWVHAIQSCWEAYERACDAGISYQDARYILPEGTTSYIMCEYTVREFINVFAYRGCSMFLWEMVGVMREMRRLLLEQSPWLRPYVKISCEKGTDCTRCDGTGWLRGDGGPANKEEGERARSMERAGLTVRDYLERCAHCGGRGSPDRKCTFQGWENVEQACDLPWAKQSNRVFLPSPKYRIGA